MDKRRGIRVIPRHVGSEIETAFLFRRLGDCGFDEGYTRENRQLCSDAVVPDDDPFCSKCGHLLSEHGFRVLGSYESDEGKTVVFLRMLVCPGNWVVFDCYGGCRYYSPRDFKSKFKRYRKTTRITV